MDNHNHHLCLFSFLVLFSISASIVTATFSNETFSPLGDIACSYINCGQGTCKASSNSLLGFDCQCNSGWRKIQIGPFTFPSCLIPNCTVDFHCGNESPSAPPPPVSRPPPSNQTNHCDFIWCGDGKCVTNGTGHICQCNQGSENLLNSSDLACVKPCYFGADCQGLGLDLPLGSPSPPPPPPPPSLSSGCNANGLKGVLNCSGTLSGLIAIALLEACLLWF